jgi:Heterokaryon incompatibility protein (HET)
MGTRSLYALHSLAASETSIRVLSLEANPKPHSQQKEALLGNLRVVDLNDKPVFTALSYVWGEQSDPEKDTIHCEGHRIQITHNCWSALCNLQKIFGSITIWIDAICINQDDAEEKKRQIPLMGTIFSLAQPVYIWLGNGTKETDEAMDYLARGGLPFNTLIRRRVGDQGPSTGNIMALRLGLHLFMRVFTFQSRPYFTGLDEIMSRPWIERLWTLQEALLARDAVIVCGKKYIPWISMMCAVEYMDFCRSTRYGLAFPPSFHNWRRLMLFWSRLRGLSMGQFSFSEKLPELLESHTIEINKTLGFQIKQHGKYLNRGQFCYKLLLMTPSFATAQSLLFLLGISRHRPSLVPQRVLVVLLAWLLAFLLFTLFVIRYLHIPQGVRSLHPYKESVSVMKEIQTRKSFRPEDKYYSIFGIIGKDSSLGEANVGQHLGAVYQALFVDLLEYTKSLDILLFTAGPKLGNCPSWVVDWCASKQPWINVVYWHVVRRRTAWDMWRGEWAVILSLRKYSGATPESESTWDMRPGGQLAVRGVVLGRVSWSSGHLQEITASSTIEQLTHSIQKFRAMMHGIESSKTQVSIRDLALFVGVCSGKPKTRAHRDTWVKVLQLTGSDQSILENLLGHRKERLFPGRRANPWDFHVWITNFLMSEDMVLVRYSENAGFGVAATATSEGDVITLISGVSMPMVLRPDKKRFRVVGPAFLPGMMDGEIWKKKFDESPNGGDLVEIILM